MRPFNTISDKGIEQLDDLDNASLQSKIIVKL